MKIQNNKDYGVFQSQLAENIKRKRLCFRYHLFIFFTLFTICMYRFFYLNISWLNCMVSGLTPDSPSFLSLCDFGTKSSPEEGKINHSSSR